MILSALTVALIEKQYHTAALWALTAAAVSATGLMHGYKIANSVIVNAYGPFYTWQFVFGYASIAVIIYIFGHRK